MNIHPLVLKKTRVFRRHKGIDQMFGKSRNGNYCPFLLPEPSDYFAVITENSGDYRRPVIFYGAHVGKVTGPQVPEIDADTDTDDHNNGEKTQKNLEKQLHRQSSRVERKRQKLKGAGFIGGKDPFLQKLYHNRVLSQLMA